MGQHSSLLFNSFLFFLDQTLYATLVSHSLYFFSLSLSLPLYLKEPPAINSSSCFHLPTTTRTVWQHRHTLENRPTGNDLVIMTPITILAKEGGVPSLIVSERETKWRTPNKAAASRHFVTQSLNDYAEEKGESLYFRNNKTTLTETHTLMSLPIIFRR